MTLKTHFLKNLKLRFCSCGIRIARHSEMQECAWITAVQGQDILTHSEMQECAWITAVQGQDILCVNLFSVNNSRSSTDTKRP